jgi:hypothetical protein
MALIRLCLELLIGAQLAGQVASLVVPSYTQIAIDSGDALLDLNKQALQVSLARIASTQVPGCTKENVAVRKEWCVWHMAHSRGTVIDSLLQAQYVWPAEDGLCRRSRMPHDTAQSVP